MEEERKDYYVSIELCIKDKTIQDLKLLESQLHTLGLQNNSKRTTINIVDGPVFDSFGNIWE